jgi:hypothetical protein
MTNAPPIITHTPVASVTDAKRKLAAWGDSTEAGIASAGKRLGSSALNLAGILAATGLVFLILRRVLPTRFTTSSRLGAAAARMANSSHNRDSSPRRDSSMIGKLGWMALSRGWQWLLPRAMDSLRSVFGAKKPADGVPPFRSAP